MPQKNKTHDNKYKIILALGNPGKEYANTYHNIGQILVDLIEDLKWRKITKKHFIYAEKNGTIIAKPKTYMNESGIAANEVLSYFKISPDKMLVIHDDSDFAWGSYKFAYGKNSAGHKGVESVINELGTKNFWRLRVGIRTKNEGAENEKHSKAREFVLKNIPKEKLPELRDLFLELRKEIT